MNTPNMDDIQCLRTDLERAVSELFDAREEIKRLETVNASLRADRDRWLESWSRDTASLRTRLRDALAWSADQAENRIKVLGPDIHPAARRVLEELALLIRSGPTDNVVNTMPYD